MYKVTKDVISVVWERQCKCISDQRCDFCVWEGQCKCICDQRCDFCGVGRTDSVIV